MILGQMLAAGEGQNPARQAARAAGIPDEKTAFGINQLCGSGLRAVALAAQQIRTGESDIVVAGGMESMSLAPHAAYLRDRPEDGSIEFIDTMLKDGLWDAFHGYHMGTTAENVARAYQITREEQDAFALGSPAEGERRAEGRQVQGRDRPGHDEGPQGRHGGQRRRIHPPRRQRRRDGQAAPAFSKDGTVTAGNASGINDARRGAGGDVRRARPRSAA